MEIAKYVTLEDLYLARADKKEAQATLYEAQGRPSEWAENARRKAKKHRLRALAYRNIGRAEHDIREIKQDLE